MANRINLFAKIYIKFFKIACKPFFIATGILYPPAIQKPFLGHSTKLEKHFFIKNFWLLQLINEMFHHASQYLMKYKYPFTTK